MWLDNVYLRAVAVNPPTPDRRYHFIGLAGSAAARWPLRGHARRFLTRVTLQGDGLGPTTGLWADEPSYAESAPPLPPPTTGRAPPPAGCGPASGTGHNLSVVQTARLQTSGGTRS